MRSAWVAQDSFPGKVTQETVVQAGSKVWEQEEDFRADETADSCLNMKPIEERCVATG